MIIVRIPKDTREYKERMWLGLTFRQLAFGTAAMLLVVPPYMLNRTYHFMNQDILSFVLVILAAPLGACGFIKINGMPFEKFLKNAFFKVLRSPNKRLFKVKNRWRRELNELSDTAEPTKKEKDLMMKKKWEKLYLLDEAEKNGEFRNLEDVKDSELVTVKDKSKKKEEKKMEKDKSKKKAKETPLQKLEKNASEIIERQTSDPNFIPNKKEERLLRKYNKLKFSEHQNDVKQGIKEVKTKNKKMEKRRKVKTYIPQTAQETLPYLYDYDNGLFEVEEGVYSKTYKLKDVNFIKIKTEEQEQLFLCWGEFLNYFGEDVFLSVTIDNRIISESELHNSVHYKMQGDDLDVHREEYNKIMDGNIQKARKNIRQQKLLTISLRADSPYEAEKRFSRIDTALKRNLTPMGSDAKLVSTTERLEFLHDKFRKGKEGTFKMDYNILCRQGLSTKDYVAPTSFSAMNKKDYFQIADGFYRCVYVSNMPTSLSTDFIQDIVNVDFPIMTTTCIEPVANDKALKMVGRNYASMRNDQIKYEKTAMKNGYSQAFLPRELKQSLDQAAILLDDIQNKSQKMFFVSVCIMIYGANLAELEENTALIKSAARKYTCQIDTFDYQQEEAMKVTFPMGISPRKKCFVDKALTTEATAIFLPFSTTDLYHKNGCYYGINPVSNNIILCDRTQFKTPSGFVLGSSGAGKSFAVKREIFNVLFRDNDTSIIVIDPEAEYVNFCRMFGGVPINISAGADVHINAMDMSMNYGLDVNDDINTTSLETKKKKALVKKSDYIMSIVQSMLVDANGYISLTPSQRTIIDRATQNVYKDYLDHDFDEEYLPTLKDLQAEISSMRLTEDSAAEIATGIDYYINGSMGVFAEKTNVDYHNRFVVFNIKELGVQLTPMALLIVLDYVWDKMSQNFSEGKRTYTYVDEIHVLFRNDYAAQYLRQLYKRGRKFGLVITGITQDVEDLLSHPAARGMISNSDFVMMLAQKSENLKILSDMLNISEDEQKYVTNVPAGCGLLYAEQVIVPFVDEFPETSYLYKLISTKFEDNKNIGDIQSFVDKLIAEHKERTEVEKRFKEKKEKDRMFGLNDEENEDITVAV